MKNKYNNFIAVIVLIAVSIFALKSLFHPGFYTSHDGWHSVARLFYFDQIIKDGQFPVRFSANLLNGFGYPLFIFSYHLPWIIAEPFILLGLNIFDSLKAVLVLTYILSGIFMYFWIKQMFGKKAGLISALVYLFTPYRFANILVRANMGEAVSFMVIPLIFWSIYNLHNKKSFVWICIGALGFAAAILSHIMVVFLFLLAVIFYIFFIFYKTENKVRFIIKLFFMTSLGLGVSSFYILPAIYYKPMTIFSDMYKDLYMSHFTPISKLFYSPWGYGALGTTGEMSRQVGIVIWITNIISLPITIYFLLKKQRQKILILPFMCLFVFCLSIYFMTSNSLWFWKIFNKFTIIDFPWRFLAVTTFISSILAGWLIFSIKNNLLKHLSIIIFIVLLFYTNRNHVRVNQYTDIPLSLYIESELSTNTDDEYLPKWVSREYVKKQQQLIVNQDIDVANIIRKSNRIEFDVDANNQVDIQVNQMWFPGWIASVNGADTDISKSGFGGMIFNIPKGKSHINLKYTTTPVMIIGNILTIISILVISIGFILNSKICKKK